MSVASTASAASATTAAAAIAPEPTADLDGLACPICLDDALDETARESGGATAILGGTEVQCAACGERLPIVLGVPYLGRFMQSPTC